MSEDNGQPTADLSKGELCNEQPFPSALPKNNFSESEEYWEVRGICGRRRDARSGKIQFLVQWVGCPDEDCTWEDEENCTDCCDMIVAFLENQSLQLVSCLSQISGLQANRKSGLNRQTRHASSGGDGATQIERGAIFHIEKRRPLVPPSVSGQCCKGATRSLPRSKGGRKLLFPLYHSRP